MFNFLLKKYVSEIKGYEESKEIKKKEVSEEPKSVSETADTEKLDTTEVQVPKSDTETESSEVLSKSDAIEAPKSDVTDKTEAPNVDVTDTAIPGYLVNVENLRFKIYIFLLIYRFIFVCFLRGGGAISSI